MSAVRDLSVLCVREGPILSGCRPSAVSDAGAVLAEARRLLRPGGVLVVADATGKGLSVWQLLASIWRILRRWGLIPSQKGQQNLNQASLEALVLAAGFSSIEGHPLTGKRMNAAFVRAIKRA